MSIESWSSELDQVCTRLYRSKSENIFKIQTEFYIVRHIVIKTSSRNQDKGTLKSDYFRSQTNLRRVFLYFFLIPHPFYIFLLIKNSMSFFSIS